MRSRRFNWLLVILPALSSVAPAMEIQWTRTTGQFPVEASLFLRGTSEGLPQILVLNRGGQLLLWTADGKDIGSGQDGMVAKLPPGQWTTAPTPLWGAAARFVFASVDGQVVALDQGFQRCWEYKLAGKTVWGRAIPAVLSHGPSPRLVFNDLSGAVTCLTSEGKVAWTNASSNAPGKAPPRAIFVEPGEDHILVPAGSSLVCYDTTGVILWQRDLGSEILTQPEILDLSNRRLIVCGTAAGKLCAVSLKGEIIWEFATGDSFSHSVTVLYRRAAIPLVVFTGLWGNLHAVDAEGRHAWTHLFRAKVRAKPLVFNTVHGDHAEIFVPTFHQHVYQFDDEGRLKDDIRLSGIMPAALTPIFDASAGREDLLVGTTTLLAYRLRPGIPRSQYGTTGEPRGVTVSVSAGAASERQSVVVSNPNGALLRFQVSMTDTQSRTRIIGPVTGRSTFEVPLPEMVRTGQWAFRATAEDLARKLLAQTNWTTPEDTIRHPAPLPEKLHAWPTAPFGAFVETRLVPPVQETTPGETNQISVDALYLDEADQAAFVVASTLSEPVRARISVTPPTRADGGAFGGTITLRQVIPTGSVNGEQVADALPALAEDGLMTLSPNRSAKIWLSVDTRGAESGTYTGRVAIAPLAGAAKIEMPLRIEVLPLRLPKEFPLTLCTWDYVPNRWFPSRSKEVLEDMGRHGVNVFPRTTIPPARLDAGGKLTIDWAVLDAELARLKGRGKILFHLGHPPIEFGTNKTEKFPTELEYIRAFRDHLKERGWDYADYAFYLLDEPGLDYGTNVPVLLDAGKLFRAADPKLLTYTDPVPGLSWKDFERIEPLVDLWAPNMRLVSGLLSGDPRIERIMKAKTVWSYECVAQVKSLSPLRYNRANAWRAKFFGLSGIGFWTHSTTEADIWQPGKSINDEFALVYPGELPVPSIRWEAVRDGLEDVAAMALLEEEIRRHRAAGTQSELVHQAEQRLRTALRDAMELSDETFVESRDFLREGDRVLGHTWTDVEMFRRHRREIARLTLALSAK